MTPMDDARRLCHTSVDDARSSLFHESDLSVLDLALQYAIQHDGRKSLVAAIRARIRTVEKNGSN